MGQIETKLRNLGNNVKEGQKEMMLEIQEEMMKKQMTNQLNMQNAMRERQIAMQIGVARERFEYKVEDLNIRHSTLSLNKLEKK